MMPTWIRPGWQPQRSFRALLCDQLRKTVSFWQTLTTNLKTLSKMFRQFIGFVAAIRTLKQNWFATLAVKQWQINNGVLLFSSSIQETRESYCIVHHASNCYSTARKIHGAMVQSFCSKKLQRLILDDTFFCLIFVAVATYNKIMICYIPRLSLN